jgi:hypothetical protein
MIVNLMEVERHLAVSRLHLTLLLSTVKWTWIVYNCQICHKYNHANLPFIPPFCSVVGDGQTTPGGDTNLLYDCN